MIADKVKADTIETWKAEIIEKEHIKEVLDKIRAEIEYLRLHKAEFLTSDSKVCIDSQKVLNIIDKYRKDGE
jgi:hypothetical protein